MSDTRDKPTWIPPMEFDPSRAVPAPVEADGIGDGLDGEVLPPVKPPSGKLRAAKVFAASLATLVLVSIGFDTVDLVGRAMAISPVLGGVLAGLGAVAVGSLAVLTGREVRAYRRLRKVDTLRTRAAQLRAAQGHGGAHGLMREVAGLYAGRGDVAPARTALTAAVTDAHDDREVLELTERLLLSPIDRTAYRLVVKASRDVAIGTAISPSALLDAVIVLWRNMRLVREVASLYAARPGLFGSARLLRRMAENIGVAGVAETGDTLVAELLGAGAVGTISTKLGTGVLNGLLSARIGLTAMHLCRPLPFAGDRKPRLGDIRRELLKLPKDMT